MSSPNTNSPNTNFDPARALQLACETLTIESDAISALQRRLAGGTDSSFVQAVGLLLNCEGRVVVSGIGKSGHIARKIAATFASTGTPAFFVHAAEAAHGDLGMITANDVFIAISYSGEAGELLSVMPLIKRMGAQMIAITGNPESGLAKLADIHLNAYVDKEACPLNPAPTASTTVTLALGDALAVAVLDASGFREEDFARSHPGGALGRRLLTHVRDIMRKGNDIPSVKSDCSLVNALLEISRKGLAMTAIVDENNTVLGVFTDGDLRRLLERMHDFTNVSIADVMHKNPRMIGPDKLAVEAVKLMETHRINQLLVADSDGKLVGALHIHDLTRAKGDLMSLTDTIAHRKAAQVRIMIFDVDGVLTDGRMQFSAEGEAMKSFFVHDGLGIQLLQKMGIATAIISARLTPIVNRRAADLGITYVYQGNHDKRITFAQLLADTGMAAQDCGFMGDDIIDLPLFSKVGFAVSVPNGHAEAISRADYVTKASGGLGAVREICDFILRAQNKYDAALAPYLA